MAGGGAAGAEAAAATDTAAVTGVPRGVASPSAVTLHALRLDWEPLQLRFWPAAVADALLGLVDGDRGLTLQEDECLRPFGVAGGGAVIARESTNLSQMQDSQHCHAYYAGLWAALYRCPVSTSFSDVQPLVEYTALFAWNGRQVTIGEHHEFLKCGFPFSESKTKNTLFMPIIPHKHLHFSRRSFRKQSAFRRQGHILTHHMKRCWFSLPPLAPPRVFSSLPHGICHHLSPGRILADSLFRWN